MSLLLNVAAEFLSPNQVISEDGATVSRAITFCDNLIDDPSADHSLANSVAETINRGESVAADVIPLGIPLIAYSRPETPVQGSLGLAPNYPNPFSGTTTLQLALPSAAVYRLDIIDTAGRLIRRFSGAGERKASVVWDGTDATGLSVVPGVYFYRLESGGLSWSRRMLRLR